MFFSFPSLLMKTLRSGARGVSEGFHGFVSVCVIALPVLSRIKSLPLIPGVAATLLAVSLATTLPAFQDSADAFLARWDTAATVDASKVGQVGVASDQLIGRMIGGMTAPLRDLETFPVLGSGIGMASNVVALRLAGDRSFLIAEDAFAAALGEMGWPLGLLFILWRVLLSLWLLRLAWQSTIRRNPLPMIFAVSSFLLGLNGSLGVPTNLSFVILAAGLTLVACNSARFPVLMDPSK